MALDITTLRKAAQGAMYISPERLCVSEPTPEHPLGELVGETDPRAVRLLVGKGGSIPATMAAKYGLIADASPAAILEEVAATTAAEADTPPAAPALSRMRKPELLALATERGLDVSEENTVAELLELLGGE